MRRAREVLMVTYERKSPRVWTVAEAKARLSEVLRRAEDEPQRIGTRKEFVVVPASAWDEKSEPRQSFGQWLLENVPRGGPLELPPRDDGKGRAVPFSDWTEDDWQAFDLQHAGRGTDE